MIRRIAIITFILAGIISGANAQKGLFVRFNLGPGYIYENSKINDSGMVIGSKNHCIGWGISDNFALYLGEFGSLNKLSVGDYTYVNTDVYGMGVSYRFPKDFKVSVTAGSGKVSLAKSWKEPTGDPDGKGFGFNLHLKKEWYLGKHWGVGIGPQTYYLKTADTGYQFFGASLNFSVNFYLSDFNRTK